MDDLRQVSIKFEEEILKDTPLLNSIFLCTTQGAFEKKHQPDGDNFFKKSLTQRRNLMKQQIFTGPLFIPIWTIFSESINSVLSSTPERLSLPYTENGKRLIMPICFWGITSPLTQSLAHRKNSINGEGRWNE